MKKFIVALTTLGLISAMSVATFADNFANFNDAQPMQNFTSDINKLYTSNLNKVSSNVVNDLDIKDGYFSCYNGYVYYLDNSKSGYTDLRRMKADKTGDILIHRIVTGESYTLSSYILGDSNLYYTIYNIKTQQHSFRKVDLVTKKDSLIYSSDTAMLEVLASQNGYAYVCETSFDENNDIHRLIYKVNVNTNKRTPLDNSEGVHNGILSASGNYIIDRYSTPDTPRQIEIVNTQNRKSISLLTAKNPYEGFTMPAIETGTIKAADGKTDLYYRLVKPADFDPNKKYPAIVYVYGGPHAQMITNGWMNGARGWDIYMANKGYIMFTLDNRGSSNRGLEFENVTFRHLGVEEGKDQVKGVDYLKSLPYVDGNRIGVHGWSFGGHMTTALMLRYPEIFKVGVAGGPVIDWKYYEIMYGERYMDTPQANPEGYEQCDLKNLAGQLKGHLLIIHDDHDDTCVPQHTLSFMKACVDARTYPDLFIYPGHKHNVLGRDRVHLHEKITRYFEDYL